MRWLLIAALALTGTASQAQTPGPLRSFGDWVVGCDNLRFCSALGLGPEDGSGAYVLIRRGGASADPAIITLHALASDPPGAAALRVDFGRDTQILPAEPRGPFLVATVPADKTAALVRSLATGTDLDLTQGDADPQPISLRGSAAALLFMDDQQARVGTPTALIKPRSLCRRPGPADRRFAAYPPPRTAPRPAPAAPRRHRRRDRQRM